MKTQPQFHWLQLILLASAVLAIGAIPSAAQITTGSVIGQVRDNTNKPLSDAIVTVINANNRNKRATRSNDNGNYVVPNLPPGSYHLIAAKDGFATQCIASFQVLFNKNNAVKYPPHFTLPKQSGASNNPTCQALLNNQSAAVERRPPTGALAFAIAPPEWNHARRIQTQLTLFDPISGTAQITNPSPVTPAAQVTDGSAATGLVNTSDVTRSSNFTAQQLAALPLGAASYLRSFDELAMLAPGVAPPPYTPGVRGPGIGFGIGSAGQFAVNGMRARSNNFSIDGTDNNDPDVGVRRGGYVAQALQAVGSVAEVSISTLLWSAEVGRNFGSQVNAVSKYGGTNYHGQLEGFFTDSRIKARDTFDYVGGASKNENPFTRTQGGASLSGPLFSQRTQFYFGVEESKTNASVEEHFSAPSEHRGFPLALQFPCSLGFLCPPYSLPSQSPLYFYPLANNSGGPYGTNTYSRELPADGAGVFSSLRLTQQIATAHALNGKYAFSEDQRILPSVNGAISSTIYSRTRSQNFSLILDSQFTPQVFQQARVSFGRTRIRFPEHPLGKFTLAELASNLAGSYCYLSLDLAKYGDGTCIGFFPSIYLQRVGEIHIAPFSPLGVNAVLFPQGRVNNNYQFADTISWHKGNHWLKAGGDLRHLQFNNFQDRLYRTQLTYGYGWNEVGNLELLLEPPNTNYRFTPARRIAAPSLELGLLFPSSTLQTLIAAGTDSHINLRMTESLYFVSDTWQVRPRLTFVAGLRYEYATVPRDARRRIEDALTLANLPQPTTSNTPQERASYEEIINAYRQVLGGRTQMYDPDRNNLGPQFGFAWGLGKDPKTSLRAGYGVYYDAILGAVISQSRNLFPNQIPVGIDRPKAGDLTFPANCATVLCEKSMQGSLTTTAVKTNQLQGGSSQFVSNIATLANQINAGLAFSLPAQKLPTPIAQQWHVTVEHELAPQMVVSAGYVGTRGSKLTRISTPNLGPANTPLVQSGTVTYYAPNPPNRYTRPALLLDTAKLLLPTRPTSAIGSYQIFENAAASSYHALQIEATKRYGKQFNFTAAYTWSHAIDEVSDIFPISGAPVVAQSQRNPQSERGNANFDLRHRFTSSLMWDIPKFKGWQLAAIAQAQTGQPFTITLPIDANLDGNLSDRPATLQGLQIVNGQREQIRLVSGVTLNDFLVQGKDGVVGRNTLRGAGFVNFDVALGKTFRFAEQRNLVIKAEVFNLFNRANFGLPVRTLDAPGFGAAVGTVHPARMLQVALKFNF